MKKLKKLPVFKSEDAERKFWDTHNFTDHYNINEFKPVIFPNLKPTSESISLRIPAYLLAQVKELAHKRDVPYQSLIKLFISERVEKEYQSP